MAAPFIPSLIQPITPEAVIRQLEQWQSDYPGATLLALLPEAEKHYIPTLQAQSQAHNFALAGAVFPALLTEAGFSNQGLLLVCLPHTSVQLLAGLSALPDPAKTLADQIRATLPPQDTTQAPPTLFMIFDAMVPNIHSLLDEIYLQLADRVHYAGINAGSESFQPLPCLFDHTRNVGDGVLCLLLPASIHSHLAHGYPTPQHLMTATTTTGNCISTIDWQPAFEVYRALISRHYGIHDLNEQNFYQYACHFPFGILRAGNDVVVRIPVALTSDGSLFCVGEVPANAMLVLLRSPGLQESDCIDILVKAIAPTPETAALLTFYCAGRRMHLGEAAATELAHLHTRTGERPLFGALSLGEIGAINTGDYPCFHNATLVTLSA